MHQLVYACLFPLREADDLFEYILFTVVEKHRAC